MVEVKLARGNRPHFSDGIGRIFTYRSNEKISFRLFVLLI